MQPGWSHARRKFFELAYIAANARRGKNAAPISTIALEAVKRIDAIFDLEREISGAAAKERLAARGSRSVPLVAALEEWMRALNAPRSPGILPSPGRRGRATKPPTCQAWRPASGFEG